MINELYIIGDQSRLVVKNIINQFKETGLKINVFSPEKEEIANLPNYSIELIIVLSDNIDFNIIRSIVCEQKKHDYHLCFIGRITKLSLEDDEFFRKIPSIKLDSYAINSDALIEILESNDKSKKHILVVDDEPIVLRSIKIWLGDDFEVSVVNSGEMAIEFLDMHPIDLVLLDYKMPTMDGPKVLAAIRKDERIKNLPVIFLTGSNDRQSVINVMPLKPDGYILKSKSPDEIKDAVVDFFKHRVINV